MLHSLHPRWLLSFTAVAALSLSTPAIAEEKPSDAQLERLNAAGRTLKWNYVRQGKGVRYGYAEALVQAPASNVRTHMMDYAHYKDLSGGKFKTSRMIAKEGQSTDVYFQVPVMHGMITLWYVSRFGPVQTVAPNTERVEGTFVRGNIKDMHLVLTARAVNERFSVISCDLYVKPNLAAPQSAVDEELRDACGDAVEAVRDKAQGFKGSVPFVTPPPEPPPPARAGQ